MIVNLPTTALRAAFVGMLAAAAAPANAASYVATSSTFDAVFARAGAGDTIILQGRFGRTHLADRSFATPLQIDARQAQFDSTLSIQNVRGLAINGGTFGSTTTNWQNAGTIRVEGSSGISFTQPRLLADGGGKARGLTFSSSSNVSVTGGSFSGFRLAIGVTSTRDGMFTDNAFTRSTSDGMNIVNSHRITARGNNCTGGIPSAGAHADCIQLWSLVDNPVQSDIQLLYNIATGATQGFTSFDAARGGGLRISMIGNRVDTSMPQGIACYGCIDSIITDNVLTTLPGSRWRTSMNIVGGRNNTIANNSIGPLVPVTNPRALAGEPGELSSAGMFALSWEADASLFAMPDSFEAMAGDIPEPGVWVQLIAGFGALGGLLRLRRRRTGSTEMLAQKAD